MHSAARLFSLPPALSAPTMNMHRSSGASRSSPGASPRAAARSTVRLSFPVASDVANANDKLSVAFHSASRRGPCTRGLQAAVAMPASMVARCFLSPLWSCFRPILDGQHRRMRDKFHESVVEKLDGARQRLRVCEHNKSARAYRMFMAAISTASSASVFILSPFAVVSPCFNVQMISAMAKFWGCVTSIR